MKFNFLTIVFSLILLIGTAFSNQLAMQTGPGKPAIEGTMLSLQKNYPIGGNSSMLTLYSDYALTSEGGTLVILDATLPRVPQILIKYYVSYSQIKYIEVVDHYAFIVTDLEGTFIYDLTNINAPHQVGNIPTHRYSLEKAVYNSGYLYIGSGDGVDIYNASNLENPEFLDTIYGNQKDFCIHNNIMYQIVHKKISVYNITDPASPVQLPDLALESSYSYMVKVIGEYLYVMDNKLLRIYNISDPNSISTVSTYDLESGYAYDIAIQNNRLYIADNEKIHIIDISDKENPSPVTSIIKREHPVNLDINAGYLYVTLETKGIEAFDTTSPDTLVKTAEWNGFLPTARQMTLDQNDLYIAMGYNGIFNVDITLPAQPQFLYNYQNSMTVESIKAFQNYLYADFADVCHIVDYSNPLIPQFSTIITLENGNYISTINGHENYLYLFTEPKGLMIYNISNPESPGLISESSNTGLRPYATVVKYPYIYVADYQHGFYVYSVSDPVNPVQSTPIPVSKSANDIAVNNDFAYIVKLWSKYINVFDISDPTNPVMADSIETSLNYPTCCYISNNILYVGGRNALQVFDLSDPANPKIALEKIQLSGSVQDIQVKDNMLYTSNDKMGLELYEIQQKQVPDGIRVTNTNDSGPGSLRSAIEKANANTGSDTIRFAIPDYDERYEEAGFWSIYIYTPLPEITDDSLVILGESQREFLGNDPNPLGPEIAITGQTVGNDYINGFNVYANDVVISGLVIYRFPGSGIFANNVKNLKVMNCYLGLDPHGYFNGSNDTGIHLWNHCSNCIIGGQGTGNVICDNDASGIFISDSSCSNIVQGNQIGYHEAINQIEGNKGSGIALQNGADSNQIIDNIICDNFSGIQIFDSDSTTIEHNRIGSLEDLENDWGNNENGISIYGTSKYSRVYYNLIAYNEKYGVDVGNNGALYNRITENSITLNKLSGIITQWGGNRELEPPVLVSFVDDVITGNTGPEFTIELYNDSADQGRIFLGSTNSDNSGSFSFTLEDTLAFTNINAIAIDDSGNTSAFSNSIQTDIKEKTTKAVPTHFALQQNYPNPFNAGTRIPYQLKENSQVTLTIYNITGQIVRTLLDTRKQAGFHEIHWNGKSDAGLDLPSGTYILHFRANEFNSQQKLLYLK